LHEKNTAAILRLKGYEEFLPLQRHAINAAKNRNTALFPGYLFCLFDQNVATPIVTTPGVLRILGLANGPEPVNSAEIAAIRHLVNSELQYEPCPFPKIGERVCIISGALSNVEGILERHKGRTRFVVTVTLLNRSVAVEIANEEVEVVKKPSASTGNASIGASPLPYVCSGT
jgi:transcription antitermination factor NusG